MDITVECPSGQHQVDREAVVCEQCLRQWEADHPLPASDRRPEGRNPDTR